MIHGNGLKQYTVVIGTVFLSCSLLYFVHCAKFSVVMLFSEDRNSVSRVMNYAKGYTVMIRL